MNDHWSVSYKSSPNDLYHRATWEKNEKHNFIIGYNEELIKAFIEKLET